MINDERQMEFYDKTKFRPTKKRMELYNIISNRLIPADLKVLDLGCGFGRIAWRIQDKVKSYLGIDFSIERIREAVKLCKPKMAFENGNIYTHQWPGMDYDIIVITEVLEHIYKDKAILKKIRSGTPVIITVPNNEKARKDGKPNMYPTHLRIYNEGIFKKRYGKLLKNMKFQVYNCWLICEAVRV